MLLLLFAFALIFNASALTCHDSSSFEGEERDPTEPTCPVNSVCMYYESKSIDGYVQQCALPSYCTTRQEDTNFWQNTKCCDTDLCNDSADDQSSSASYATGVYLLNALLTSFLLL